MRSAFIRIRAAALLLLALSGAARAQEGAPPPVEVTYGSRTVGLTPPPGCQTSPEEVRALASERGLSLKYGCVTSQKDALLLLSMPAAAADAGGLADHESSFKKSQNALFPGVRWLGRDTVKIGGDKWVRLRYREGPTEKHLVNHAYIADWAGQPIMLVVGAPAAQYERLRAGLERSAKSIQLSISVHTPAAEDKP